MIRKVTKMIAMILLLQGMQTYIMAQPQMVIMGGQYSNPDLEIGNVHRTPILPILVEQDAGIFTFNKFFAGETIEILIEGIVLYTSIINEGGIIEIPESITGEVELRLIRESITYHAFVNL